MRTMHRLLCYTETLCATMFFISVSCFHEYSMNLKTCKVTHSGISFTGTIGHSLQGFRCLRWSSLREFNSSLKDKDFPDGSMRKAKNFCRNPTKDENGPWCYITASGFPVKQQCDVPLCASPCRLTGPGAEYSGTVSKAMYQNCEKWNNDWHKRKIKLSDGSVTHGVAYADDRFPDRNVYSASNYCRNPDGSLGGPWCYVLSNAQDIYAKIYCEVPDCYERDNVFISKQNNFYSHFISFKKGSERNITLAVRLWNPDLEHEAAIKILLSTLSVPTSKENIRKWGSIVELTISNKASGTNGNDNQGLKSNADYLKATEYTTFNILWNNNVLRLFRSSDTTEPIYAETLSDSHLSLTQFSMSGDIAMWALPFGEEGICQEHTTFLPSPLLTWKLREDDVKFYLELSVRSFHSALIYLTCEPYHEYPRISIKVGFPKSVTAVIYEQADKVHSRLATTRYPIGYWSWTRLRIVLLGKELRVLRQDEEGAGFVPLLTLIHNTTSSLRYFSIGSNHSVTHWALFCEPPDLPAAYPPNCAMSHDATDYKGDQWVSYSGLPCLPWIVIEPLNHKDTLKLNYCRNYKALLHPWCYVQRSEDTIKPEICDVRKCNAIVCKKAGTANDYVGDLTVTRSNRSCKRWPRRFIKRQKHEIDLGFIFEENYCRNPTREAGGAWCFTTDSYLRKDLCEVKDCDKLESRIVLTKHNGDMKYTYVIPKWRDSGVDGGLYFSMKRWDPTLPEGILFRIFAANKNRFLTLYIGAENNEQLILRYTDIQINKNVLLIRKIFPHVIPGGKWSKFRLQLQTGRIRLGYETKDLTILDWRTDEPMMMFNPAFISYESIGCGVVGVYFPGSECHVENTSAPSHSRLYPITWQSDDVSSNLTLYIRGSGIANIPLVHFPSQTEDYLVIVIDEIKRQISLNNRTILNFTTQCAENVSDVLLSHTVWNRYDVFSKNNSLYVVRNNTLLLKWDSPIPFVYYFFSVCARQGWVVWTANCSPPDIDSALQDGGWSPWSEWHCSVSCGKGVGYRQRRCSNPKPTIFGMPCFGPSEQSGICNDFQCGHLSPQTHDLIQKNLKTKSFNIIAKEGSNITIKAPVKLLIQIKAESPTSKLIWMHKGIALKPVKGKYYINVMLEVFVTNITRYEDGLYVCIVKSNTGVDTPIKVVFVAVEPTRSDVMVYNESPLELTCPSALLTFYADLWIKWYHNETLFTSTDIATIDFNNTLRIPVVSLNHTGIWKCVMEQTHLDLRWVVQIYNVIVILKPSSLSVPLQTYATSLCFNLMVFDNQPKPTNRVKYILVIVTVIVILICLPVFYRIFNYKKNTNKVSYEKLSGTENNVTQIKSTGIHLKKGCDKGKSNPDYLKNKKQTKNEYSSNQYKTDALKKPKLLHSEKMGIKIEVVKAVEVIEAKVDKTAFERSKQMNPTSSSGKMGIKIEVLKNIKYKQHEDTPSDKYCDEDCTDFIYEKDDDVKLQCTDSTCPYRKF